MAKKPQKIIITGSLVTTLFLSHASASLAKVLSPISHQDNPIVYVPKTFQEHVEEQLVTADLSQERLKIYERILQKVQNATGNQDS